MHDYMSISLKKDFLAVIDDFVKHDVRYQSRADFAREAIREKMQRLREIEPTTRKQIGEKNVGDEMKWMKRF